MKLREHLDRLVADMLAQGVRYEDAQREFEKRFIARVLQRHGGNMTRAARDLGIHRNTLGKKVEEYEL